MGAGGRRQEAEGRVGCGYLRTQGEARVPTAAAASGATWATAPPGGSPERDAAVVAA